MLINGFAGCYYLLLPLWSRWKSQQFLRLEPIRIPQGLRTFVFVATITFAGAVTLFATLVQFVSPFLAPELHWQRTYRHACDGLNVRAYLDSAESRPARDIKFENLASGERYTMRMDPDPWISAKDVPWVALGGDIGATFRGSANPGSGYSFTVVPAPGDVKRANSTFVPTWEYIRYNAGYNPGETTFTVFGANDTLIHIGTFVLGQNFTVPYLMIRGDLGPFAERCVFDSTAVVYSTNRTAVAVKKTPVMKTMQFSICDLLQVCADEKLAGMAPVPVGLLMLQRARRGFGCCRTKRRIPGIEGRDWD